MTSSNDQTTVEVECYKLSEIFSIIPEFEGDQIFLGTFINACDCAYNMSSQNQKALLVIHIKNKLRGRAAQLISSRNPNSYLEIKQLLNLHFGDSRDLTSLIQDLQRMKQVNESPLTFFNRLQVLNAKMQACVNKTTQLNADQKRAQTQLIDTMVLNTLLTGLDPRIGQVIRASNPKDILEAHARIRRELQLTYFEEKHRAPKPNFKPAQPFRKPSPQHIPQRNLPNTTQQSPNTYQFPKFQNNFQRPQQLNNNFRPQQTQPFQHQQQPSSSNYPQNRPFYNPQNRPSVIQRNPNFNSRAHCVNYDYENNYYYPEEIDNSLYYDQPFSSNDLETPYFEYGNDNEYSQYSQYEDIPSVENYTNFLSVSNQNHPPITTNNTQKSQELEEIQEKIRTLNMNPDQKFL